jgi:hypothetical protein
MKTDSGSSGGVTTPTTSVNNTSFFPYSHSKRKFVDEEYNSRLDRAKRNKRNDDVGGSDSLFFTASSSVDIIAESTTGGGISRNSDGSSSVINTSPSLLMIGGGRGGGAVGTVTKPNSPIPHTNTNASTTIGISTAIIKHHQEILDDDGVALFPLFLSFMSNGSNNGPLLPPVTTHNTDIIAPPSPSILPLVGRTSVMDDVSNSNMKINNMTVFSSYSADERPSATAAKISNEMARLQKLLMEKQQEQDQQAALLNPDGGFTMGMNLQAQAPIVYYHIASSTANNNSNNNTYNNNGAGSSGQMQKTMMPFSNNTFGSGNSNSNQPHRRFRVPTSLTVSSSLMNTMMDHHQGSQYFMNNMNGGHHSNGAAAAAATHSVHNNSNRSQTQPVLPSSAARYQQQQQQQRDRYEQMDAIVTSTGGLLGGGGGGGGRRRRSSTLHYVNANNSINDSISKKQVESSSVSSSSSSSSFSSYDCNRGRSRKLFLNCDYDHLSEYQCLLRNQIELFEATQQDVASNTKGRNKPVAILGQVGVRCVHCKTLAPRNRPYGATCYPAKLSALYQAAQLMASGHLLNHCTNIPDFSPVRQRLSVLRKGKSSAGGGKKYWIDAASILGVHEHDGGLQFRPTTGNINSASTSSGFNG